MNDDSDCDLNIIAYTITAIPLKETFVLMMKGKYFRTSEMRTNADNRPFEPMPNTLTARRAYFLIFFAQ